jgi:hypothetical protein
MLCVLTSEGRNAAGLVLGLVRLDGELTLC